jgi:hypothetical protein
MDDPIEPPYFDHGPLTRRELAFDLLPHDEDNATAWP